MGNQKKIKKLVLTSYMMRTSFFAVKVYLMKFA